MRGNNLHQFIITEDDMIDVLYNNQNVSHLVVDDTDWVAKFKQSCQEFELPVDITWESESNLDLDNYIEECLNDWSLPEEYMDFDVQKYIYDQCTSQIQIDRVAYELDEFEQRGMLPVLRWLKYFIDTLKENNLIWGVGRGSSVASYVLFLLEIHRVDSIKYELDIKEFLK